MPTFWKSGFVGDIGARVGVGAVWRGILGCAFGLGSYVQIRGFYSD